MPRHEFNPIHEHILVKNIVDLDERETRKKSFRVERMRQRESLATIGGMLIEEAMGGATPEALLGTLDSYKEFAGMVEYQEEIFRRIIKEYGVRRNHIETLIEEYGISFESVFDDAPEGALEEVDLTGLFEPIFGWKPQDSISVEKRPFTLHFVLGARDYARIGGSHRGFNHSAGMHFSSRLQHRIGSEQHGTISAAQKRVIAIPIGGRPASGIFGFSRAPRAFFDTKETDARHEETHALYDLLSRGFVESPLMSIFESRGVTKKDMKELGDVLEITHRQDAREQLVQDFWSRFLLRNAEPVKDELFAYYRAGDRPIGMIKSTLTSKKDGAPTAYDFFSRARETVIRGLPSEEVRTATDRFFIEEYGRIIRTSIDGLDHLVSSGFTIEQAMVFLIDIPLPKWKEEIAERTKFKQSGDL